MSDAAHVRVEAPRSGLFHGHMCHVQCVCVSVHLHVFLSIRALLCVAACWPLCSCRALVFPL
jgi:hypothetical protein